MELIAIRKKYVETYTELERLRKEQNLLSKDVIKLLDNEPDEVKRKEIIDQIFEGKVNELHEYYFRKTYLKE